MNTAEEQCESCGRWGVTRLIYFNDLGPTTAVCTGCALEAGERGCTVMELTADGQVIVAMPGGDAA